jgi:hypothetical protein
MPVAGAKLWSGTLERRENIPSLPKMDFPAKEVFVISGIRLQ